MKKLLLLTLTCAYGISHAMSEEKASIESIETIINERNCPQLRNYATNIISMDPFTRGQLIGCAEANTELDWQQLKPHLIDKKPLTMSAIAPMNNYKKSMMLLGGLRFISQYGTSERTENQLLESIVVAIRDRNNQKLKNYIDAITSADPFTRGQIIGYAEATKTVDWTVSKKYVTDKERSTSDAQEAIEDYKKSMAILNGIKALLN
jgi:hypothetical protein